MLKVPSGLGFAWNQARQTLLENSRIKRVWRSQNKFKHFKFLNEDFLDSVVSSPVKRSLNTCKSPATSSHLTRHASEFTLLPRQNTRVASSDHVILFSSERLGLGPPERIADLFVVATLTFPGEYYSQRSRY